MPSIAPGFLAGQISVDIGEMRAGNVAFTIQALTLCQVHQIVATIEYDPLWIIQMERQVSGVN